MKHIFLFLLEEQNKKDLLANIRILFKLKKDNEVLEILQTKNEVFATNAITNRILKDEMNYIFYNQPTKTKGVFTNNNNKDMIINSKINAKIMFTKDTEK